MRLIDYLDKGASLGSQNPCLTMNGQNLSYGEVQSLTYRIARALQRDGINPGDKVAILSGNDPIAFTCVFGLSRAGAVWCPINPRNELAENRFLLDTFDCACLIFHSNYAQLAEQLAPQLPKLKFIVCIDKPQTFAPPLNTWLNNCEDTPTDIPPPNDIAMIAGTGGTTGKPKGVMLTGHNLETMTAITLMSYPFSPHPKYLALAPLTHAAGVLCFPIMTLGGQIIITPKPDLATALELIQIHQITHIFLPPTLIYMLIEHPNLPTTNTNSLQCFWYGAAPISPTKLETAIQKFGPVMAQLFGQTEAPMMISTMSPQDHFLPTGEIARHRLSAAGRPSPLTTLAIINENGQLLPQGQHGEIVIRGPLVTPGYYKNPSATAEISQHGWHHTGDIGYLDEDNFLYIVDRAKDMIITGGFNVYSTEVEQILLAHEAVLDCAVIGLPDDKWGERVTAVIQLQTNATIQPAELIAFVKNRIGSMKTPKQIEIWPDLPRSKVGKILKKDIRNTLLNS